MTKGNDKAALAARVLKLKAKAAPSVLEILEFIDSIPMLTPGERIVIGEAVAHIQAKIGLVLGGSIQQVREAGKIGVQLAHEIVRTAEQSSTTPGVSSGCTCAVYSDAPGAEPSKAVRAKAAREAKKALARIQSTSS